MGPHETPRGRFEDIKNNRKETDCEDEKRIEMGQDKLHESLREFCR
jgi:hypothetical protein